MGRSERIQERLKNIPVEVPGTWYHEDIPWLLEENARLEAERDAAKETIRKVEDRLNAIFGATEYVKPGTGIYMTTKVALECIKEWRGAQHATGAERTDGER